MSLKENQNLLVLPLPPPFLSYSLFSLLARGNGVSLSFNHSCCWCIVRWPWPLLKRENKNKTSQGFLPYSPAHKCPVPSQHARKICFCPNFCCSQALYSSLSGDNFRSNLGDKREEKMGNIFYMVFLFRYFP